MSDFEQLRETVMQCQKCGLRQGCTHVVFGEGARDAKIMCIGEGPGYYEDQLGRPFVGASVTSSNAVRLKTEILSPRSGRHACRISLGR